MGAFATREVNDALAWNYFLLINDDDVDELGRLISIGAHFWHDIEKYFVKHRIKRMFDAELSSCHNDSRCRRVARIGVIDANDGDGDDDDEAKGKRYFLSIFARL